MLPNTDMVSNSFNKYHFISHSFIIRTVMNTKFGIVAPLPGVEIKDLINFAKKSEDAGLDSVWYPDHILFMAKKLTPEVWSVITGASVVTDRIQLGAIGDPHRMHPVTMAHRLATVDHISDGRVFSCIGYGEKMNLDDYGIEWNRALSRLKDSVEIMRGLWTGEPYTHEGRFFNLNNAELRISPVKGNIPLFIAATGPKALNMAGKIGNGWVTNAMPTWVYEKKTEAVNNGLSSSVIKNDRFERAMYVFLSIAKKSDEAYATLDKIKHAIIWPDVIEEAGYKLEIDEQYKGLSYTSIMPNDKDMLARFREMGQKYYTREILSDFVVYGTAGDVIKRLQEYIDSGVNHFILRDFSPDLEYSFDVLTKEVIDSFK